MKVSGVRVLRIPGPVQDCPHPHPRNLHFVHSPCLTQALPSSIRKPWQLFRDKAVTALGPACARSTLQALQNTEDVSLLFAALPSHVRFPFVERAVVKAASFLYYHRMQFELGKETAWDQLTAEQQEDMSPAYPREFVRQDSAWHPLLGEASIALYLQGPPLEAETLAVESLPASCCDILRDLTEQIPEFFGMGLPTLRDAVGLKKEMKSEPAAPRRVVMGMETCEDLQRELLRPWKAAVPEEGAKLHYGAVLHALVQHATASFGPTWPNDVIILCSSACERQDLLTLQRGAKRLVGVLCTETHWACCFAQKGCPQVLLADGLEEAGILEAARAFLLHLADRWPGEYNIEVMPQLRQNDGWSCGHRVVLTSEAVMKAWVEEEEWPVRVAMSTCTAANIQAYCKRRPIATPSRAPSMPTPSPAAASKPVKSEVVVPASSSPPAPSPAAASKPVKSEVVVPASSSPPAPSPAAASKPVKSEVDSVQEPEPTTPKAKKHKSSHVLPDDEQEAVHAKQPPPKRRKLTEAQKRQAWRQEGLQLCQQKGVDYRNVFQQTHANLKAAIPQNHWPEFLIDLGRNVGHMKCHACRALRLRMLSEQSPPGQTVCPALGDKPEAATASAQLQLVPAVRDKPDDGSALVEELAPQPQISLGRGRPPKGSVCASLFTWMDRERPGMYRQINASLFWCYVCKAEAKFHRLGESGKGYVLEHEKTKRHQAGLSQEGSASSEPSPCPGVQVGASVSSFDNVQTSCEQWLQSGQLRCKVTEGSQQPFDMCVLSYQNDQLFLKHQGCTGTHVKGQCCAQCHKLSESKELQLEVARWGMRLSMLSHARALALGVTEDRDETRVQLLAGDFMRFAPLKKEVHAVLAVAQEEARLLLIKRKLDSINRSVRTERLHSWLSECVVKLRFSHEPETERRAYRTLCEQFCTSLQTGTMEKKDLQLAARVAAGGLNSSKMIACLFHSWFDMLDRMNRHCADRLASSRHVCHETLQEISYNFGTDMACQKLMHKFGVNMKGKTKIDYQISTLPAFFLGHLNAEQLLENVRVCNELLRTSGTRDSFITVDETNWRPAYGLVSGLMSPGEPVIVGGHWKDNDNCAALSRGDPAPQDKRAHLTVHWMLSRTDSLNVAFCASALPMPHKDTGCQKSQLFLQLAGELLSATARANQDLPARGLAFDGGTSNAAMLKTLMGLQPCQSLPFWDECECESGLGLMYFPFKRLTWRKKHVVLPSLDCNHVLKRFCAHHFSGSRVVCYGRSAMLPSCLLQGGIPYKAYVGTDTQSDKQAILRLAPGFLLKDFDTWGCCVFQLLGSLASSGWEGARGLSHADRSCNCSFGYYLILLFMMLAKELHGKDWHRFWIPLQTTRNTAFLLAMGMLLCLQDPAGCHETSARLLPFCFSEKIAEHYFSRIKQGYRGQPSVADGICGAQKEHMRAAARRMKLEDPKEDKRLGNAAAKRLSEQSWRSALAFVAWTEPERNIAGLEAQFKLWWASEGAGIMTFKSKAGGLDEDTDEEAEDLLAPEPQEEAAAPDEDLEKLQSLEDHIEAKLDFEAVAKAFAEGTDLPEQDDDGGDEAMDVKPGESTALDSLDGLNFPALFRRCTDVDTFPVMDSELSSWTDSLQRQLQLKAVVKKFVLETRLRERVLSRAVLEGNVRLKSEWHRLEHELSLARQATLTDGSRQSRTSSWRAVMERCAEAVKDAKEAAMPIRVVSHYSPEINGRQQLVVFIDKETPKTLQLGLVKCVFRGAVARKDGGNSRKLRCAKLSVQPLPASSCSRILVRVLTKCSDNDEVFFCCSLSAAVMIDPVEAVVGEASIVEYVAKPDKGILRIAAETAKAIQTLQDNPALLECKMLKPMPEPPADAEQLEGPKIFTHADFSRTIGGSKNIVTFMRSLPQIWKQQEVLVLDDTGHIHVKTMAGQAKVLRWEEICIRTPDALDILLEKVSNKAFGKTVLNKFLRVLPQSDKSGAVTRLKAFAMQINEIAQPVPGA